MMNDCFGIADGLLRNDPIRPKTPVAVVAAGNWLIAYDRIGSKVLDLSQARYGPDVELYNAGTAGLSLLDCIDAQDLLLVVDACNRGGKKGEIRVSEMDFEAEIAVGSGSHQIGLLETLTVARHLFPEKLPRRVLLILIETEGMTDTEMDGAARRVVKVIDGEIARYRVNS